MDREAVRGTSTDRRRGFSPSGVLAPFHDALVPGIRGLGERGFSTALGNLHERIALVIGVYAHAEARRAFDLSGPLPVLAREFITQRILQLSRGEAAPDHPYEREQLLRDDPYGRVEAYAHPHPLRFFDFAHEVKMGAAF